MSNSRHNSTNVFLFSILIPTWNNLDYLKLCINSINNNSRYKHQIIIHVNEGVDGTLNWLRKQKIDFSYSRENIGICFALNTASSMAACPYIVYFNDDMYACPDWDHYLYEEIKKQKDESKAAASAAQEAERKKKNAEQNAADWKRIAEAAAKKA